MVYIYLIYGLSFFILWTVLLIYHMKLSRFPVARNLWMIGLFGLSHGISDWLIMLIAIQNLQGTIFKIISIGLLILSFCFLIQFGISTIQLKRREPILNLLLVLPLAALLFIIIAAENKFLMGDIFSRYILGVPGSLLTFYALFMQIEDVKKMDQPTLVRDLKSASFGFLCYGFFSGLVVPEAGFFPASVLNYRFFISDLGIPVELLRAVSVLVIAFSLTRVLHVFEVEIEGSMRRANERLEERVRVRTEELDRLNEELRQRELQEKAILDNIPDMAWLKDEESRIIKVNEAFARSAGTTAENLTGKTDFDIWPKDLAARYRADDKEVLNTGRRKQVEEPLVDRNDRLIWVETIRTPIYNLRGQVIGTTGIARDITERKKVEEALRESENRYRAITETALDAIITIDQESTIILTNAAVETIFGYTSSELFGRSLTMLMPDPLKKAHRDAITRYVATGRRHLPWGAIELPGRHKDGRQIPLEMSYGEFTRNGKHFFTGIVRDISKHKEIENALRESERRRQLIMDAVPAMISYVGRDLRYQFVNHQYEEWFGRPAFEIIGKHVTDLLGEDRYHEIEEFTKTAFAGEKVSYERSLMRENRKHYLHIDYVPHLGINREVLGFFTLITDITDRKKIEQRLQNANERLSTVLNSITEAYYVFDSEWRLIEINKEAEKILGPAQEITGKIYWETFPGNIGSEIDRQYHLAVKEGHPVHFEARSAINDRWYELHAYPRGKRLEVYFRDITERKEAEQALNKAKAEAQHQAYHDGLTGLPNRLLFMDIFGLEVAQARRNRKKLALLFLDLDRFKEINDTLGHDSGDQLLKHVAARLKKSVRESDTVARIGGDEFNVLLSDIEGPDAITATVSKITTAFQGPYSIAGQELRVTTSIGISIYPDDSTDIETLLKFADAAMYHAKELGRNRYQFYDPAINTRTVERMHLENSLRKALDLDELIIYYLPQIHAGSRRLVSAEALLRWRHPELGLLAPRQFIPVAEETGAIVAIGKWMLRAVARQIKAWEQAGHRSIPIILNLSGRQFRQPDLPNIAATTMREAGLEPDRIQFEISEQTATRDVEFTRPQLQKYADAGFTFSIDDYGTGCLPLNILKKLYVQKLKIDQSIIRDILSDPDNRVIVSAMIAMSHSLKLKAVAEGVETEEQLQQLQKSNCDEIQGYLVSSPRPVEEYEKLLAA